MLAPIAWRTPPRLPDSKAFTSMLTEALVARGVDVTLFATLDSQTGATLDDAGRLPRRIRQSMRRCGNIAICRICSAGRRTGST
ncbi:hypothetical protein AB5I41_13450 [Sphingomonas sp. MMS24-JH45]